MMWRFRVTLGINGTQGVGFRARESRSCELRNIAANVQIAGLLILEFAEYPKQAIVERRVHNPQGKRFCAF